MKNKPEIGHLRAHLAGWTGIMQAATLSPVSTSSTEAHESQLPLSRRRVGPTGDENFSIWRAATKAPIAMEAVQKIDVLFEIERGINGLEPDKRVAARHDQSEAAVL